MKADAFVPKLVTDLRVGDVCQRTPLFKTGPVELCFSVQR